jgi:hypothetical protein
VFRDTHTVDEDLPLLLMRITLTDRDPSGTTVWFHGAESMLAGAGAGLVTSIVTCPLDVIKTRLQAGGLHGGPRGLIGEWSAAVSYLAMLGFNLVSLARTCPHPHPHAKLLSLRQVH